MPSNIRRIVMSAAGTLVVAAAVGASLVLPSVLTVATPNAPFEVQPQAVHRNLVCAGGVYDFLGEEADLTLLTNITPVIGAGEQVVQLSSEQGESGSVIAHTAEPATLAATEMTVRNSDDIRGVLAAECGDPLNDAWLVGGDTSLGREAVLVITNGSDVDATIDLDIWGVDGVIAAPGSKGLVIPALSQRAFPLAGFAPSELSPVIRITSNGAPVWSVLQTSVVRGLVAGGLDRVTPNQGAATEAYFPIFSIESEDVIGPLRSDPDFVDMETVIRVFAPGEAPATVSVRLTNLSTGETIDTTAEVPAGRVTELVVDEIPAGQYSAEVQSDVPVVAGLRFAYYDTKAKHADHAWASAAQSFTGTVAVVAPVEGTLSLQNASGDVVDITVSGPDGDTNYTLEAHQVIRVSTSTGNWVVASSGAVSAAHLITVPKGIAVTRGIPAPGSVNSITVYTG